MESNTVVYYGVVCWFCNKKGFGFLEWEENNVKQPDMFVHFSDISCEGFKSLFKGQKVSFNVGTNKHGSPKAINVKVLNH